jgi:hypothetical protein
MENYEDLLRKKYLLGTPKEQYEWVENLVKRNAKLEGVVSNMKITLSSIKGNCNETIQGLIQNTLDVTEKHLF